MKRLFIVFGVLLITLLCGITAFAAETDDSGIWEYRIFGSGVELTGNTEQKIYPASITI